MHTNYVAPKLHLVKIFLFDRSRSFKSGQVFCSAAMWLRFRVKFSSSSVILSLAKYSCSDCARVGILDSASAAVFLIPGIYLMFAPYSSITRRCRRIRSLL